MGQKEMGAGRRQGRDTKAKTHELRGGQMGTGEETAGVTPGGKRLHRAAVGTGGRGGIGCGYIHTGSLRVSPLSPRPAESPSFPAGPLHPRWSPQPLWVFPAPLGAPPPRSPQAAPLRVHPGAFSSCPGQGEPGVAGRVPPVPALCPGPGVAVQGSGQPLAGAAGPRSAQ